MIGHSPASIGLVIVLISLFPTLSAPFQQSLAQTTSGTLFGTVHDEAGRGVDRAKVTIINDENGNQRSKLTDGTGVYTLFNLPPGTYRIVASKQGFIDQVISHFPVQFNQKNVVQPPQITLRVVTLVGKVVDGRNRPLPGAGVVVAKESAGIVRDAVTDDQGSYRFSGLATGNYIISVSRSGKDGVGTRSVQVALDRAYVCAPVVTLLEAVNEIGNQPSQASPPTQIDEGEKARTPVHTLDPARSVNFTERQIRSLPLGGATAARTFDDFALLVAGVAPPPFTPGVRGPGVGFGIGTAGQFSVNGMRARSNNFSVDGSDNNDTDVGVRRQGFVALVSQSIESVKEISISTLLWDAELGRNLGSQVNAVSEYGANRYHGQAYIFFSDSRLNARNAFDYTGGASGAKDPYTRTQAGFVIGGPIDGNRTQFLVSYEREKLSASTEQHFSTPTIAERSFLGGRKFGVQIQQASGSAQTFGPFRNTTPLGRNVLSFYPEPNDPGGPYGVNTFTQVLPADGSGDMSSVKFTHEASANNALSGRYSFTQDSRILPSVNRAMRSTLESNTRSQNLSLILDSAIGNYLFNQARFSFGRTWLEFLDYPGNPFLFSKSSREVVRRVGDDPVALSSQTGPIGELVIVPFSPVGIGAFTFPQSRASNTFQYADSLSLTAANHSIKFGGNARRYQLNSVLDRLYRPQVVYGGGFLTNDEVITGVQLASLGVASSVLQTVTSGTPNSTIGLRFTEYHVFINDNWRLRPSLAIDFGLRYEYDTVPREVNRRIEKALQLDNLPTPGTSRFDTPERIDKFSAAVNAYREILDGRTRIYEPDFNNFGPHVGFAWSPGADGKTAIRAGYGIYYDTNLGAVVSQSRNVFPNEIPINVDPSFFQFDIFNLNNPAFLALRSGDPSDIVRLLRPGVCNRFGACNQFGGAPEDFAALIGQVFLQNKNGGLAFTLPEKNLRTPYSQQWHLTIEREVFGDYLVSGAYVGSKATKLTRLTTPNLGSNVTPAIRFGSLSSVPFPIIFNRIITGGFVISEPPPELACLPCPGGVCVPYTPCVPIPFGFGSRPNAALGAYQIFENSASSNYHALQLEAQKRYSQGFQFTVAYTWSHAIDDVSDLFPIAGAPVIAQDSLNLREERAAANFDIRQYFAASLIWDLPLYRNSRGSASSLLGGWQFASILQAHSGQPFTLNVATDNNLDGNFSDRVSSRGVLIFPSGHGPRRVALAPGGKATDFLFFNKFGDDGRLISPRPIGRNTVRGDGFIVLDVSLNKEFLFGEHRKLEFRTEVFNALNRTNFGLPIRVIGAPGFGYSVDTAAPARVVQLALKYEF